MTTTPRPGANERERQRWNDEYWSSSWPVREQLTGVATAALLERLALRDGDRVLDVGSGAGATTLLAARAVAPSGSVLGVDLSVPLVALATSTAADAGVTNVTYQVADVQTDAIVGGPFTVVMSQFGVMFFDDPVAAFSNVRAATAAGGRLGFACWQQASENPWFWRHVLAGLLPVPPVVPGAAPTGPDAFGDVALVRRVLGDAGWRDVIVEGVTATVSVTRDAVADEGQPAFLGVAAEDLDEADARVEAMLASFGRDGERYLVPTAFFVVTAHNP